jgi:hypothetical protein
VETLVKDEPKAPAKTTDVAKDAARREEIDELLRIKQSRKFDARQMPCPSCNVAVDITANRCPFCESDIAAEAALARETTRRLREVSGEIDVEHAVRTAEKPRRRGFFARLKYLFEGDPEPGPDDNRPLDPYAKRMLNIVTIGDSVKVLEEDGAWLKVKTMAGDIGWVYSTIRKKPQS